MDKYEVIGTLGEGSFGRVYKAKQLATQTFVALKVISKRGRSPKELKGFRRECEIQRDLHHPNIVQMLDSFETENEMVVITEFAPKELTGLLRQESFLAEPKVQKIVWDLVSALYYLHSNRVLHRDLKPQNILLDLKNRAKLCDFGFARNMSAGTHVLTSIKGTPLYMAPELIDEQPYDYNADLWSLGCIVYELLIGAPPFSTNSILHLIRKIKTEAIKWPNFLSPHCISFLKGLLQKKPSKRMSWSQILNHPFVKGHVLITKSTVPMPLTSSPSSSAQEAKEQQIQETITQKGAIAKERTDPHRVLTKSFKEKLNFIEDNQPIEPEEWTVFLHRSIKELMKGEMSALLQPNLTNIIVSPLRNTNLNSKVLSCVAQLLSIGLMVKGTAPETVEQIKQVYLEVKVVPNLIYAVKLLLRTAPQNASSESADDVPTLISPNSDAFRTADQLDSEHLQALEHVLMLVCHLVHLQDEFLIHFCDAVLIINVFGLFNMLFALGKRRLRILLDLISILTHTLRKQPENGEIVAKILLIEDRNQLHLGELMRNSHAGMRERCCHLLLLMGRHLPEASMQQLWSEEVQDTLEALAFDSIESVRNAAELAVIELKTCKFYLKTSQG